MKTQTIRLRPATHDALRQIAEQTGESMQDALEQAVRDRERRLYLEGINADYAKLDKDPKAKAAFEAELAIWDQTNLDGLEDA